MHLFLSLPIHASQGANSTFFGTRCTRIGLVFQACRNGRCDNESVFWNVEASCASVLQSSKKPRISSAKIPAAKNTVLIERKKSGNRLE
jgi:hypothetical protein